jgi:DNA-binding NtrC family response regulator
MSEDQRAISAERELAGAEVLVVDADPAVQQGMSQLLEADKLPVTAVGDPDKALELVGAKHFGVVIIDIDTPVPNGGLALVRQVRERSQTSLVFVLMSRKTFDGAIKAFRSGAHDVILKAPDQVEYLAARIRDAARAPTMTPAVAAKVSWKPVSPRLSSRHAARIAAAQVKA